MKIKLEVNKKRIPMKPFVVNVFYNVIKGLVETLEIPDKKIELIDISIEND